MQRDCGCCDNGCVCAEHSFDGDPQTCATHRESSDEAWYRAYSRPSYDLDHDFSMND